MKAVFPVCSGILLSLAALSAAAAQAPGEIITLAGNGTASYAGDGGPATQAAINGPLGVVADRSGNVYIADYENNCVRKVASSGIITTFAGQCSPTEGSFYSGDGGPAASATLFGPANLAVDAAGNLYIADAFNNRIRKVTAATGIITTVAGDGTQGFAGDGGLAIYAQLNSPWGVAIDSSGNLYIADQSNNRIRKVTASNGVITTIAGTGVRDNSGDGGPATSADVDYPFQVAVDASGDVYIAVAPGSNVRKITAANGMIENYAGNGTTGFSGDEGPATSAALNTEGIALDSAGNLYIADTQNNRIRRVEAATHVISTVAGSGYISPNTQGGGFGGDGGPATSAALNFPQGVFVNAAGDIFISDSNNNRVREVFPGGPAGTATSLTVPASPAIYGTIELSAEVKGTPGGPTPTGTVTFYDSLAQTIDLGTATLDSSGTARLSGTKLSGGYHILYAQYNGSGAYGVSSSSSSSLSVVYNTLPAPMFDPPPGTYHSRQQVTLLDTAGRTGIGALVQIYYTTDGSTPSATNGYEYNAAITVSGNETIKAIAVSPALANNPSPVAWGTYTVSLPAEAPLQPGEWAWESGNYSSVAVFPCGLYGIGSGGNAGNYGTLGVPGATNTPGSRISAMNWTDKNGNLWLFGGFGFGGAYGGSCFTLNDLWMFNVTTLNWTWMGGASNAPNGFTSGVYGTLGQFAAGNMPGSRSGGVTWTDKDGNLWLFGGAGNDAVGAGGELNDVWEYNVSTHQWAWMAGSKYANQRGYFRDWGVFHSGNTPGARQWSVGWADSDGDFWLFGGDGYDALGTQGQLSDLWKFDVSTRQWAWVGGSHYADKPGTYGTMGVPSDRNHPGGRSGQSGWVDKNGNFWLFGGYGSAGWGDQVYLNDMWEYDPHTFQWTWVSGYDGPGTTTAVFNDGQVGAYGTETVPEPGNTPGSRTYASAWTDKNGNLWLFGGEGFDANGGGNKIDASLLGDLWEFNPSAKMWAWMGGSSTIVIPNASVYGQFRVPTPANLPSGRWGTSTWTDKSGNLWLFGGQDDSKENDLWKYQLP